MFSDVLCIALESEGHINHNLFKCTKIYNRSLCYNEYAMGRQIAVNDNDTQLTFDDAKYYCTKYEASVPFIKTEIDQLIVLHIIDMLKTDTSYVKHNIHMDVWIEVDQGKQKPRRFNPQELLKMTVYLYQIYYVFIFIMFTIYYIMFVF